MKVWITWYIKTYIIKQAPIIRAKKKEGGSRPKIGYKKALNSTFPLFPLFSLLIHLFKK